LKSSDSSAITVQDLHAAPNWRCIDFLSDLHLCSSTPATLEALRHHLQHTPAQAVFLLGDIFEVWVGDDARIQDFEARCTRLLTDAAKRLDLYFMAGNRDFLLGPDMLQSCGMKGLSDPTALSAFGSRWLLTHGDALCLSDAPYQRFRAEVRSAEWQARFLAQPLPARIAMARQMREASQMNQAGQAPETWSDLDAAACIEWLEHSRCAAMIHGHTHRPATHELGTGHQRHVLSDWDFDSDVPRGDLLRLSAEGLQRVVL